MKSQLTPTSQRAGGHRWGRLAVLLAVAAVALLLAPQFIAHRDSQPGHLNPVAVESGTCGGEVQLRMTQAQRNACHGGETWLNEGDGRTVLSDASTVCPVFPAHPESSR